MSKRSRILIVIISILIVTIGSFIFIQSLCKLDGRNVCYDKKEEVFKIEEETKLLIQVENEELGDYIVKTWNELYPEHKESIEYIVKGPLNLTELADDIETDIFITSTNNAAYVLNKSFDLGKHVKEQILKYNPIAFENALNENGVYFVPNSVNGWTFIYNKTLAEELGIDFKDEDENLYPDSFESWENLFSLKDKIFKELDTLFPLSFKDQYSFYPFLTAGRWNLNFTNNGMDAGFSHNEFYEALEFISFLKDNGLFKEDMKADDLAWEYNTAFFNREIVFSLMSDWMNLELYQEKTDDEYKIMPMPKYKDNRLRTKGDIDGYLVNADTKYPSASAEVLRILRDKEAVKYYQSEDKTFAFHRDYINDLEIDETLRDLIYSLNYVDPDPVMVLEKNPSILARLFIYEENIMEPLKKLYDKEITEEQAQEEIIEIHRKWLEKYVDEEDLEDIDSNGTE